MNQGHFFLPDGMQSFPNLHKRAFLTPKGRVVWPLGVAKGSLMEIALPPILVAPQTIWKYALKQPIWTLALFVRGSRKAKSQNKTNKNKITTSDPTSDSQGHFDNCSKQPIWA